MRQDRNRQVMCVTTLQFCVAFSSRFSVSSLSQSPSHSLYPVNMPTSARRRLDVGNVRIYRRPAEVQPTSGRDRLPRLSRDDVGPTSARHLPAVNPTLSRRSAEVQPTSPRYQPEVQPTSGRRPAEVQPTFSRHPTDVRPLSTRHPPAINPTSSRRSADVSPLSTRHPPLKNIK